MDENRDTKKSSISQAGTPEKISEFWDSHSLADHWDQTHEVEFEVRAHRRRLIELDSDIQDLT